MLYCKGNTVSELRYKGRTLSDNRQGLIGSAMVTTANGHAEREAAKAMKNDAVQEKWLGLSEQVFPD